MLNDEKNFEKHLRKSLRSYGYDIPLTEDEIEKFEESLAKEDIPPFPSHLNDPSKVLKLEPSSRESHLKPITDEKVIENLARAAREGKDIPTEIRRRMEKDRSEAERKKEE